MNKLIVGGIGGALGGEALEYLLEQVPADQVIGTTTQPGAARHWLDKGVDVRYADYTDPQTLHKAFEGGESLLLISQPVVGPQRRERHRNAVDAAVAAGVQRIVYTSVVGAGNPANQSLVKNDHRWTEEYIEASGLNWNFLRNSQYTEAIIKFALPGALAEGSWAANQGDGKIAYISRKDCAAAAASVLAGAGKLNTAYTPSGPDGITIEEVASTVSEETGLPLSITHLTDEQNYAKFDSIGVPRTTDDLEGSPIPYCSDDMVSFGQAVRAGSMADRTDDFKELTGRDPVPFRTLIRDAVASGVLPSAGGAAA